MPNRLFVSFILINLMSNILSGQDLKEIIKYDGLYVARTGELTLGDNKVDIYTYLRFYEDGVVYTQAVTSFVPEKVSSWFGRHGRFEKKGKYYISGDSISFKVNNSESSDIKLEGFLEKSFHGIINDSENLKLRIDGEDVIHNFKFSKDDVKFTVYFKNVSKLITVPGKWHEKQIIEGGQIFITNDESTDIGIVVYNKSNIPTYKAKQSEYETAFAYFSWDSEYLKKEENMLIELINSNKSQNFIIWSAKDKDNNNCYLFACVGDLVYNFVIYSNKLNDKEKMETLVDLFNRNKN